MYMYPVDTTCSKTITREVDLRTVKQRAACSHAPTSFSKAFELEVGEIYVPDFQEESAFR